ncbi:hypothetical protein ACFCWG_30660 [Streptomyces sp. NPDC056390]|uniref:hypothetical protein n=1 Tax=Streptomyces sp. NPDC056390 TaxID=3345806 RepID=UPI0035E1F6CF
MTRLPDGVRQAKLPADAAPWPGCHDPSVTWTDIEQLAATTRLAVVDKGVLYPDVALLTYCPVPAKCA